MILEAEKSPDLLSASWSLRKAGGIMWFESKGLGTRGDSGVSLKGQEKTNVQLKRAGRKETNSSFLHHFVLFRRSVDWMMPAHPREGKHFAEHTDSHNVIWKHPHRHTRIMFNPDTL